MSRAVERREEDWARSGENRVRGSEIAGDAIIPIIGPNTSGKTTILDAIHLCLGPGTELFSEREDLAMTPSSLVRRGSIRAHVECTVRFSDEEIEKTKAIFRQIDDPDADHVPTLNQLKVSWDYPDPTEKHARGKNVYDPPHPHAYLLFKMRLSRRTFTEALRDAVHVVYSANRLLYGTDDFLDLANGVRALAQMPPLT